MTPARGSNVVNISTAKNIPPEVRERIEFINTMRACINNDRRRILENLLAFMDDRGIRGNPLKAGDLHNIIMNRQNSAKDVGHVLYMLKLFEEVSDS